MDKIHEEVDSLTGLRSTVYTSELDGKIHRHYSQDMEPSHEFAKALRNDEGYKKSGIKTGWMHAVHIPPVVQIELQTKLGIDFMKAPVKETIAGMRKLGYDHFILANV